MASGKRIDLYFRAEFFKPMRIEDFDWMQDPVGNPYAHFGLQLSAVDFAKFGELVLHRGTWNGTRIVSEKWIDTMLGSVAAFQRSGWTSLVENFFRRDVYD